MTLADFQAAFANLHLLRPHWLWALLALPLLAWAWRARRQRRSVWRAAVDPHLLPHLLEHGSGAGGSAAPWLAMLAFVLAVLALAGPSWRRGEQPLLHDEAPLVVALDLSSAMLANDLPPSRLLQARAKLATLLQQRSGGQVGLVAFAEDAYTVAPLTDDAANVALFLDALSPDVMPVDGSNAARAIRWSAQLLRQAGFAHGEILVLGYHADADARSAAAEAHGEGYRVSALGLGTAAGAAWRTPQGAIAHTRLDAGSLQAMAKAGGGRYAALTPDTRDLAALGVLDASAMQGVGTANRDKAGVWKDDGYWLLLALLLLALPAFRRGGMLAAVLLCACLPLQVVHAADGDDDGTLWRRADQVQHTRMQAGAGAYRGEDFASAAKAWQALPGADAAYNRGNALAKAGRYEDAIAAYDEALRTQPGMADAVANRKAVEAAMKRKPPPSKQPGSRGQQQGTPQSGKPDDGNRDPQQGQQSPPDKGQGGARLQQGQQQPDNPPSRDNDDEPSQAPQAAIPPQPDDAEAQRKADAAQRARMQQALQRNREQADDGQQAEGEPDRAESAAERERRRANEAWLRRVPDDPGGLLRARFRLEYDRRQATGER